MSSYRVNTLRYDPGICSGCFLCTVVCPHRVFARGEGSALLAHPERCIECGACSRNCAPGAIDVDSGVGCAIALLGATLLGREASCGCSCEGEPEAGTSDGCCGPASPGGDGEGDGESTCECR